MFSGKSINGQSSVAAIVLIAVLLTLFAGVPRFWHLGALGFYGDEETTSLASRAMADGDGAVMPSGMPYNRALPQTWVNSVAAKLFGRDEELSYRLSSAVSGVLTIPILFLLLVRFTGLTTAAVTALLLALSDWHILLSREARMYAPFLLFFLTSGFSIWLWAETRRLSLLCISLAAFVVAISLHALGLFCAIFPLILLAFPKQSRVNQWSLITLAAVMATTGLGYSLLVVGSTMSDWMNTGGRELASAELPGLQPSQGASIFADFVNVETASALIGVAIAVWFLRASGILSQPGSSERWKTFGLVALFGSAVISAVTANLHAAILLTIMALIIFPDSKPRLLQRVAYPLSATFAMSFTHAAYLVATTDLSGVIVRLFVFPYPVLVTLAEPMPILAVVFVLTLLYLALTKYSLETRFIRMCSLAAVIPLFAIGIASKWGNLRYLVEAYPFILVSASLTFVPIVQRILRTRFARSTPLMANMATLAMIIVIIPSHSLWGAYRAASISYGENSPAFPFAFYPDHKTTGEYLRSQLRPGDIVIAEDAIQQIWYTRQVDYWLRSPVLESQFHFVEIATGLRKDAYTASTILSGNEIRIFSQSVAGRIFLITSGEISYNRRYYLDDDQIQWVESVESALKPIVKGRDGRSNVYCINCRVGTIEKMSIRLPLSRFLSTPMDDEPSVAK